MPLGKAANRTSDQAREWEGNGLPGDFTVSDFTVRTFAVFQWSRFPVKLKNREANVLDCTDVSVIKRRRPLETIPRSYTSFINSRTIVSAEKKDYKTDL